MFKTFLTILRGRNAQFAEAVADQNALVILDQQMRDAAAALERAKKSLALAIAQDNQEAQRLATTEARIVDLETRVVAALDGGNETLAREGADVIAELENDRDAAKTARALFASEISRLRAHVSRGEQRLAALERGRRIARAGAAVRSMGEGRLEQAGIHRATISEAEATLSRLLDKQQELRAAEEALDEIDLAVNPQRVAEKLSAEGFGPRLKTSGEDVLAKLRGRHAASL